jgi:hypothetical protein
VEKGTCKNVSALTLSQYLKEVIKNVKLEAQISHT